ncbi:hypothetical protein HJG60_010436 [Phyllostomus discolor]|uniref:Uncharacterized protein n=1 Tax=Phyllostomus discolor TaxID=89673 RepID=A0A834AL52_9CHIR|nr:hypothetical protein HJG60_010436 [Phyllostomus discolor]
MTESSFEAYFVSRTSVASTLSTELQKLYFGCLSCRGHPTSHCPGRRCPSDKETPAVPRLRTPCSGSSVFSTHFSSVGEGKAVCLHLRCPVMRLVPWRRSSTSKPTSSAPNTGSESSALHWSSKPLSRGGDGR